MRKSYIECQLVPDLQFLLAVSGVIFIVEYRLYRMFDMKDGIGYIFFSDHPYLDFDVFIASFALG